MYTIASFSPKKKKKKKFDTFHLSQTWLNDVIYDLLLIALATYQIGRETWAIDILQHPGHTMDNITKSSGSVKWNWITKIDTEFNRRNSTSLFKQQKLFTI